MFRYIKIENLFYVHPRLWETHKENLKKNSAENKVAEDENGLEGLDIQKGWEFDDLIENLAEDADLENQIPTIEGDSLDGLYSRDQKEPIITSEDGTKLQEKAGKRSADNDNLYRLTPPKFEKWTHSAPDSLDSQSTNGEQNHPAPRTEVDSRDSYWHDFYSDD